MLCKVNEDKNNYVRMMEVSMKSKKIKIMTFLMMLMCAFMARSTSIYAADIGEKAGNYVLDQVFWIILVALVIIIGLAVVKRNISGVIVTIVIGGIALYLIKNPTALETLGTTIAKTIGL